MVARTNQGAGHELCTHNHFGPRRALSRFRPRRVQQVDHELLIAGALFAALVIVGTAFFFAVAPTDRRSRHALRSHHVIGKRVAWLSPRSSLRRHRQSGFAVHKRSKETDMSALHWTEHAVSPRTAGHISGLWSPDRRMAPPHREPPRACRLCATGLCATSASRALTRCARQPSRSGGPDLERNCCRLNCQSLQDFD